jgi:aspartate-semialdehyde dehydrogenase
MIKTLERRSFPVGKLTLLASKRSAGKKLSYKGEELVIEELTEQSFEGVDIALFSAGGGYPSILVPVPCRLGLW